MASSNALSRTGARSSNTGSGHSERELRAYCQIIGPYRREIRKWTRSNCKPNGLTARTGPGIGSTLRIRYLRSSLGRLAIDLPKSYSAKLLELAFPATGGVWCISSPETLLYIAPAGRTGHFVLFCCHFQNRMKKQTVFDFARSCGCKF